jgi:ribonuclease HII
MIAKLNEEKKLWNRGYKRVACLDEAGRGPLAGPVVAGAVIFKGKKIIPGVKDSKQLSEKQREEFYKIITKHPCVEWGIGIVSEKVIDKINILEATKLAMKKAVVSLKKPDFLILDGNMKIDSLIPQKSIIKGDVKVFSCAAASILAKVTRDRIMEKYSGVYPKYGFSIHKGYPTKRHIRMIKKYGACKIHRKSFGPVRMSAD